MSVLSGVASHSSRSNGSVWKSLYDLAVRAGVQSYLDGIAKAQVSNLLEMVWYFNADTLVYDLAVYMGRQAARRKFSRNAMKYLIEGLQLMQKNNMATRQEIARFIGIFRWVYDVCTGIRPWIPRNEISKLTMQAFIDLLKK